MSVFTGGSGGPPFEIDRRHFQDQVNRLMLEFRGMPRVIDRTLASAANRAARGIKTDISKGIRERIAIKKADIDRHIRDTRATPNKPLVTITLEQRARLSLKYFGARQTKTGISYRIDKRKGRQKIPGAFIVESRGGQPFKRVGRSRLPIVLLRGISPWGAYTRNPDLDRRIRIQGGQRFRKELIRRIDRELAKRSTLGSAA